jgi:hypothetical protein
MSTKILSFDAETDGLYGPAFAIGAFLFKDGVKVASFIGRYRLTGEINPWVKENVLPKMEGIPENYSSYEELLRGFFEWRKAHKDGATEIVHMGVPVEAKLFIDAHAMGIIGDFDGPYPLVDVSAIPEIGTSVDSYNAEHGCAPDPAEFEGGTHNPLYDSAAAANAYLHWLANR